MSLSPWILVTAIVGAFFTSQAQAALPSTQRVSPTAPKRVAKAKPRVKTQRVKDSVGFIQKNLIFTEVGMWGSRLTKGGKKYGVGLTSFGSMADLFFEDRIATRSFNSYKTLYTAGFVLTILSLVTLLGDVVLLTVRPQILNTTGGLVLVTGLLVGGAAMGLIGPLLIGAAVRRLMKAVKIFNEGIFSRARKGAWRVSFHVLPEGGFNAGVVARF